MKSKIIQITIIMSILFLIVGCAETQIKEDRVETVPGKLLQDSENSPDLEMEESVNWQEVELEDVVTGDKFKISDFRGKKVLVESFAVWCPTCTKQQQKIHDLHKEMPEFVSISLDTDPNEDVSIVRNHVNANGFTEKYAVAPKDVTQALVDKFGIGVVNAPSAPVILVCEDGSSRMMGRGLKSVSELKEEINQGC